MGACRFMSDKPEVFIIQAQVAAPVKDAKARCSCYGLLYR
jgi:hypothetical protein